MQDLSDVLQVNQHQINELNRHLHAFGDLQEKAVQALPKTQEHIELMIKAVQDGGEKIVAGMNNVYSSMSQNLTNYNSNIQQDLQNSHNTIKNTHDVVIEMMKDFNGEFKTSSATLNDMIKMQTRTTQNFVDDLKLELDNVAKDFESHVKEMNQAQLKQMMNLLNGLDERAQIALTTTGESIKKQITALQGAQRQELDEVMTEMSKALATMTKQFTNDYSQLVNEMDKVVRMHSVRKDRF